MSAATTHLLNPNLLPDPSTVGERVSTLTLCDVRYQRNSQVTTYHWGNFSARPHQRKHFDGQHTSTCIVYQNATETQPRTIRYAGPSWEQCEVRSQTKCTLRACVMAIDRAAAHRSDGAPQRLGRRQVGGSMFPLAASLASRIAQSVFYYSCMRNAITYAYKRTRISVSL